MIDPESRRPSNLPAGDHLTRNFEIVAYHDLDGRPGFKMAMHETSGRWFLYLGELWHRGWVVLDVTDPAEPVIVRRMPGPANTWTIQAQVADGRLVTALEKIDAGWGDDPAAPFEEGFLVWDLSEPASPRQIGRYRTGGNGTHRNFYAGGRWLHASAAAAGHDGHIYEIVDLADPAEPRATARWWIPGQWRAGGETGVPVGTSLHAAFAEGDRAYLAYGAAGLVILDIADPTTPRLISRLGFAPPFNPVIAVHTVVPLTGGLLAVNSEAIAEDCAEPLGFAGLVDASDEADPRVISMFPLPTPPRGAGYRNYCERGGRFGPHNLHQAQGQPALLARDDLVLLTWFNAGLWAYDVTDPRQPREVAAFVPPDPLERRGILPARRLTAQTEDVLADRRGFVYVTDKNHGLYVLKLLV